MAKDAQEQRADDLEAELMEVQIQKNRLYDQCNQLKKRVDALTSALQPLADAWSPRMERQLDGYVLVIEQSTDPSHGPNKVLKGEHFRAAREALGMPCVKDT